MMKKSPLATWCAAAMLAATLSACHDDSNNNDDKVESPTSANDLAKTLINTQTCTTAPSQSTNELVINDNQDEVDLTKLSPDCSKGS